MTQTVLERVQQYIALSATIKPDWEKYIKDKKQPLEDRWEAFLAAPSDWREKDTSGDVPLPTAAAKFDSPYDHFKLEMGESMDVDTIIAYLEEFVEDGEFTEEQVAACKEEAIKIKLGIWKYDQ